MRTEIHGGWKPVPGPNGLIAHGNGTVELLRPDGSRQSFGDGYVCGWGLDAKTRRDHGLTMEEAEMYLAVSLPMWLDDAQTRPGRSLVYLRSGTGHRIESAIPPYQLPGYFPTVAVMDGSVVSSANGAHFINGEGRNAETNANDIEHRSAKHYLYKLKEGDVWPLIVREIETGQIVRRIDGVPLMYSQVHDLDDGAWIFANVGGGCQIHDSAGEVSQLPAGEFRGDLAEHGSDVFVASVTNEGWTPVVIVREFGNLAADAPAWVRKGIGAEGFRMIVTETGLQIMGHDPDDGDLVIEDIPWDEPMQPYVKPVEPPAVIPPELDPDEPFDLPNALQPRWRGHLYSLDSWPGNVGGGERTFGAIIEALGFYNDGRPYVPLAHEARVIAPWCTPKETRDQEKHGRRPWADERAQILTFCQKYRVPVVLYADMPWWQLEADEQDFIANGVPVVRGLCAYPGSPDETGEDYSARITKGIDDAPGAVYIQRPTYTYLGTWVKKDRRLVRKFNKILTAVIERYPPSKVVGDMGFGMDRQPNDSWNYRYLTALCERTPEPIYSTLIPPAPIVIPPVQPPVVVKPKPWSIQPKPSQPKKPSIWDKLAKWLKGRFK